MNGALAVNAAVITAAVINNNNSIKPRMQDSAGILSVGIC